MGSGRTWEAEARRDGGGEIARRPPGPHGIPQRVIPPRISRLAAFAAPSKIILLAWTWRVGERIINGLLATVRGKFIPAEPQQMTNHETASHWCETHSELPRRAGGRPREGDPEKGTREVWL